MSAEAVNDFLKKVAEDEALMGELAQAMEAEDDRAAVAQLAISKGYDVTPDELWAEVQKRQAEAGTELSDEELESVAGGFLFPIPGFPGFPGGGGGLPFPLPKIPKPKW